VKGRNGILYIEKDLFIGFSPSLQNKDVEFIENGIRMSIPAELIVRFYEAFKYEAKKQGVDFEEWQSSLFK